MAIRLMHAGEIARTKRSYSVLIGSVQALWYLVGMSPRSVVLTPVEAVEVEVQTLVKRWPKLRQPMIRSHLIT